MAQPIAGGARLRQPFRVNPPIGAAGVPSSSGVGDHLVARAPVLKPPRSARDLTPFVLLAMILIPSLVVLCLAIADPGAAPPRPVVSTAVTATPGH